jgi:hypothetical protein
LPWQASSSRSSRGAAMSTIHDATGVRIGSSCAERIRLTKEIPGGVSGEARACEVTNGAARLERPGAAGYRHCARREALCGASTRMSLSLSSGAHSRDPSAHPGYACFKKIKQCRHVATRHDRLAAIHLASSNWHPSGFRHSLSSPRYRPRTQGPNEAGLDLIHRNC